MGNVPTLTIGKMNFIKRRLSRHTGHTQSVDIHISELLQVAVLCTATTPKAKHFDWSTVLLSFGAEHSLGDNYHREEDPKGFTSTAFGQGHQRVVVNARTQALFRNDKS